MSKTNPYRDCVVDAGALFREVPEDDDEEEQEEDEEERREEEDEGGYSE